MEKSNNKPENSKKNFNLIPERIQTIQEIVNRPKSNIESIIDFKNSTDSFEYPNNTEDIRELLPKKYIEFGKAISELGGKLL